MSIAARILAVLALFALVAFAAPAAVTPGINSADLICLVAPFILIALAMPRRSQTPAGDSASPSVTATPTAEAPAGPSQ